MTLLFPVEIIYHYFPAFQKGLSPEYQALFMKREPTPGAVLITLAVLAAAQGRWHYCWVKKQELKRLSPWLFPCEGLESCFRSVSGPG